MFDQIWKGAAILQVHARTVGVENTDNARIDFVGAVVRHGQGFGEALGFIIYSARTGRVHVPGIVLGLGMDKRIAIDLACGCQQEARVIGARHAKTVVGAQRTGFHGLDGQVEITGR